MSELSSVPVESTSAILFHDKPWYLHRKVVCACGYAQEQHLEVAVKPHTFQGKEWDPKKHVQEMPTDAFGDIVFTDLSQKVGKVGSVIPSPFSVLAPGTL